MIRMTLVKWLAAAALALSVPTIGMARHTHVAAAALTSVGAAKPLSVSHAAATKTKSHKKLHARSHRKHSSLHGRSHKASKLSKSTRHVKA